MKVDNYHFNRAYDHLKAARAELETAIKNSDKEASSTLDDVDDHIADACSIISAFLYPSPISRP